MLGALKLLSVRIVVLRSGTGLGNRAPDVAVQEPEFRLGLGFGSISILYLMSGPSGQSAILAGAHVPLHEVYTNTPSCTGGMYISKSISFLNNELPIQG